MPDISKITLPSGTTYDIKDPVARQGAAGALVFRGVTETEITDGSSTSTYIVGEETVTAQNGDLVVCGTKEFLYSTVDRRVVCEFSIKWNVWESIPIPTKILIFFVFSKLF